MKNYFRLTQSDGSIIKLYKDDIVSLSPKEMTFEKVTKEGIISGYLKFKANGLAFSKVIDLMKDYAKMPFKAAVEAVRHGTHQIEKDCDNLDLLRDVLKEAFPEDKSIPTASANFYYKYFKKEEWGGATKATWKNLPIIKLSEIMPKEEITKTECESRAEFLFGKDGAETIEKIDKIYNLLMEQKELISQRDCIGRELKITPIEGTFQHVGNPVEEKPVELVDGKWYKSTVKNGSLFEYLGNNQVRGFFKGKEWIDIWSWPGRDDLRPATTSEITEALKNEAIKRGLIGGVMVKEPLRNDLKDPHVQKTFTMNSDTYLLENPIRLMNYGYCIMFDGIWATPIPTLTRKEAEEKLNVKIVD